MPGAFQLPYRVDARGNRLEAWDVTPHHSGQSIGHHLWLRGTSQMVKQIIWSAPEYQSDSVPASSRPQWTHLLYAPGNLGGSTQALLELLSRVVTLPSLSGVRCSLALDWYKIPEDDVDPYQWANTEVGRLVNLGKYQYRSDGEQQARVGCELCKRLCEAIGLHPLLSQADVVLDVPGHDARRVAFGSRAADTVARDTSKPVVRVSTRNEFRPEAKSLTREQRSKAIRDQFYIQTPLHGRSTLIVDDVFRSGDSMGEVARAARAMGASEVYGICAVRTMRR
jgi:hypothetical protein